ncbi:flagellar basal body rod protein FlgB [Paludibacterium paludis]|uniref:Flagellar basal body rod protein FlgB n=1 Tax=Paludibacterium paludis TaxID=1225769 RepID=A0A918NYU6_9NEIS|nr:flagellar basal body rod protein FlgB [Paludibacterium paludis]GGY06689.1 flagellar basal body rod protein FlgB [Paludibacterium paludis]
MLDKIARAFDFQQRALNLRAYRSEVLASNIANADTPYYKAMDLDFRSAMLSAGNAQSSLALSRTDARHFGTAEGGGKDFSSGLMYRNAVQRSLDGNTVDMDVERGAFAENALKYQSTLTFLNKRISGLADAIKGGQ